MSIMYYCKTKNLLKLMSQDVNPRKFSNHKDFPSNAHFTINNRTFPQKVRKTTRNYFNEKNYNYIQLFHKLTIKFHNIITQYPFHLSRHRKIHRSHRRHLHLLNFHCHFQTRQAKAGFQYVFAMRQFY